MNLQKLHIKNSHNIIFGLFLLLHVLLLNINAVEWGDSYRILRASNFIQNFSYPSDEKRPPLYSAVLALRPEIDAVEWGRLVMLVVSVACLLVFYKLCLMFFNVNSKAITLALLLFAFNPVFFYWSIRIYADVFLSLFILTTFYLLTKWKSNLNFSKLFLIGILVGLSVLTRFEGYLLFAATGLGIFFLQSLNFKNFKVKFLNSLYYLLGFLLVTLPYLYIRNPLTSTYLDETSNHKFNFTTISAFLLSLLFIFGIVPAFYFIFSNKNLKSFAISNVGIVSYLILNLLLVFAWPSAIPRLFVSGIPFLILILAPKLAEYFETNNKPRLITLLGFAILLVIFVIGQEKFRLQFLIPQRNLLIGMILLQFVVTLVLYFKKHSLFLWVAGFVLIFWTISTIYLHKDINLSLKSAAQYTAQNLSGKVVYNDVSSVSDWYLSQSSHHIVSKYQNFDEKNKLTPDYLLRNDVNYLLITNEFNPDLELDLSKRPFLILIKEFSYKTGGKIFYTKVVKVSGI